MEKTPGWYERCFAGMRGRIVALLLRQEGRTVRELAEALGISSNAVRDHLETLESDGLVRPSGQRAGLRKPHVTYSLTPEAQQLLGRAYAPFLSVLLDVLAQRLSPETESDILLESGRRLAARYRPDLPVIMGSATPAERLAAAVALLQTLGGQAEINEQDNALGISSDHCPLSLVTAEHPDVCLTVEALLSDIAGVPIRQRCERSTPPRCHFVIASDA